MRTLREEGGLGETSVCTCVSYSLRSRDIQRTHIESGPHGWMGGWMDGLSLLGWGAERRGEERIRVRDIVIEKMSRVWDRFFLVLFLVHPLSPFSISLRT